MEYYNNILTVEAGWMIEQGIFTSENYRQMAHRGDIQVVRRGCRNTPALVAYDSLPDRYKQAITERVGNVRQAAKRNVMEGMIEHSAEASDFFEGYMIDGDRHLPADKRKEYYTNAIVLDGVRRLIKSRNSKRKALGSRATRFWEEITQAVQDIDIIQWSHTLPLNPRSLERKYKRYIDEGHVSLIHKAYRTEVKNAAKIATEDQKAMLVALMADPRNLDNAQVARLYNMVAEEMNRKPDNKVEWKTVTASAVAVWRDKCDDLIYARRHGSEMYRANREMQVKRSAPTRPLLYWTMDGWDIELMYQHNPERGATTYHNRLTMVVVLDAFCKYPVGFAVGRNESPALIREALHNAECETRRLFGAMYRVGQLQSDHFSMKTMTPTYHVVADKVTPARVKNAKAKIIEPWFNYFNKKYCQFQTNWSGFGITSRKELQPNTEYIAKYKNDFPDFEGAVRQIVGFIEAERAELVGRYTASFAPDGLKALETAQYLMAFGASTGERRYLLQGCGIRCTIGGRKVDYDCFDTHFRKHASTRWQLRYDPDDIRLALAVNEDESLQFVLEEKHVQPMALAERTESDYGELQRVMDFNRRKEQELTDELAPMEATARELLEQITLSKLLITDSRGQHKLPKAKARLAAAHAELAEAVETGDNFYDMY